MKKNKKRVFQKYLIILIILCCVISYVWHHHRIWKTGYIVAELEQKRETLIIENKRLQVKVKELEDSGRIEKLASEKLEMKYPAGNQFVFIEKKKEKELKETL